MRHFNPRSPCGERHGGPGGSPFYFDFNPRSPCGERPVPSSSSSAQQIFQPTLPVRGATADFNSMIGIPNDFNPRSPCGERPSCFLPSIGMTNFNPRSPCGERHSGLIANSGVRLFQPTLPVRGATALRGRVSHDAKFQPTLPVRGATALSGCGISVTSISTHAPRAGSDATVLNTLDDLMDFNPRSPCGERRGYSENIRRA